MKSTAAHVLQVALAEVGYQEKRNDYQLEELVPVVAKLAESYTSKDSTSVTFEKARQLMEAVIYCIQQCEGSNQLAGIDKMSAQDAYAFGYEQLLGKVKQAQHAYSEMIVEFEEGQDAKAVMQEVLKNCKKVEDDCEIFL